MSDKDSEYDMQPDDMADDMMDVDDGGFDDQDMGEAGDYADEDWEAFDEEQYIDDGDGDTKAQRVANFNRLLIGGAVCIALGAGGWLVMHKTPENMGLPEMAEVAPPAQVAENQKVEFHTDTKVAPQEAFGVRYGEKVDERLVQSEEEKAPAGLLNNPNMLEAMRQNPQHPVFNEDESQGQQPAPTAPVQAQNTPQVVEETGLPMPAPITASDDTMQDTPGLIPLPGEGTQQAQQPAPDQSSPMDTAADRLRNIGDIPRAPGDAVQETEQPFAMYGDDDVKQRDGDSADQQSAGQDISAIMKTDQQATMQPVYEQQAAPSAINSADSSAIIERLDKIDARLARLDSMEQTISALENRIGKLERSGVSTSSAPSRSTSSNTVTASRSAEKPAAPKRVTATQASYSPQWVLKSAQPGKAMISRKGENDMISVSIGETVSGLGRITGIYSQGGRWVVQGTNGKVTQ